jgi:hypothetical protein
MAHYRKAVAAAVALNSGIFVVEAVAGFRAHSLSLLMDSVHNLSHEMGLADRGDLGADEMLARRIIDLERNPDLLCEGEGISRAALVDGGRPQLAASSPNADE